MRHAHKTSPQSTTNKSQPWIGTSRSAGVGGSGFAIALGSGWPTGIETHTKGQNQLTGYYDQAQAMKWDLAVSRGRGVWVSVSDSVRVELANRN